jgi:small subunit ribosomal protein S20
MANIKSAEKRAHQAVERNLRNRSVKSQILTASKVFLAAVEEGDKSKAQQSFSRFASLLDKSAKKGIVKPNNASRHKSRAAARLAAMAKA